MSYNNRRRRLYESTQRIYTHPVLVQGDNLVVFDRRTLKHLATLSTFKKVLMHLEYNHTRDEIISGGSDGCHVWRLAPAPRELYAPGKPVADGRRSYETSALRFLSECSAARASKTMSAPLKSSVMMHTFTC